VEQTVEAVTGTVQAVGETAQETVEAVKQAFNFSEQYEKHPWLFFAGSVALGFLGGKLVENVSSRRERASEPFFHSQHNGNGHHGHPETYATRAAERFFDEPVSTAPADQGNGKARESGSTTSWLGKVAEHFGGELNKLKGLALGTMFGVARDMITQAMPQKLKTELGNVFDSMTETAGGKPIHGPILEDDEQAGPGSTKGDEYENHNQSEMDRPVGAAQGKGKTGMGKPDRR
jgi:hypothetical protein